MLYNNDNVFTSGLTGMSGAGKSTACRIFSDCGFTVIDCDKVAREVTEKGRPALECIADRFGGGILNDDGTLARRKLAGLVFSDPIALTDLNSIIYPYITFCIVRALASAAADGKKLFLLDAPTLFESGADMLCDTVVCVTADREICEKRITERDRLTADEAKKRLSSQHDASFYTSRSGYSAVNNGSLDDFESELRDIAERIKLQSEECFE